MSQDELIFAAALLSISVVVALVVVFILRKQQSDETLGLQLRAEDINKAVRGALHGSQFLYSVVKGQGLGDARQMLVRDEHDTVVGLVHYPIATKVFRVIEANNVRYQCFRERRLKGDRVTLHLEGKTDALLEFKPKLGGERIYQDGRVKFERNILEGPTWPIRTDGDVVGHVQSLSRGIGAHVNVLSMAMDTPLIEKLFLLVVFDKHLAGGES